MHVITPLAVVVPLLAAPAIVAGRRRLPRAGVRAVALGAALTVTGLGAVLLTQHGLGVYWFGGWEPRHGVALGVSFAVDSFGASGVVLAGVLTTASLVVAGSSPRFGPLAHVLTLILLAAAVGFCLTGDLFNLFVFYELMSVCTIALCALDTGDLRALRGALHFAISNSIGAFFVLIGIAMLYARTGALNLAAIGQALTGRGADDLLVVAVVLITVGFLIKAAIVPFHFWLVDAASAAPTPVAMLLVGLLDTLGLYAIARIYWSAFAGAHAHLATLEPVLLGAGVATAVLGAMLALREPHPTRRLAFVAVSHSGLMLVGVGLLNRIGLAGFGIYAGAEGATKAALFALVPRPMAGVAPSWGRARRALLVTAALVLAGVPPAATSLGKGLIEAGTAGPARAALTVLVLVVSALTAGSVLLVIPGDARMPSPRAVSTPSGRRAALLAAGGLLAITVGIGAVPGLARVSVDAAARFENRTAYAATVLGGQRAHPTVTAAPDLGATPALLGAGAALGAVAVGAGGATRRRRRPAPAPRASPVRAGVDRVLALHRGSLGDSAAWITFGTATIGAALALGLR